MLSGQALLYYNKEQTPLQGNFAVQPQVFRGGRFGVWGTPPPKPLNCKVWEKPAWRLRRPCLSLRGAMFPESKIFRSAFRSLFSSNKKPCLLFGKQGFKKSFRSLYPLTSGPSKLIVVSLR